GGGCGGQGGGGSSGCHWGGLRGQGGGAPSPPSSPSCVPRRVTLNLRPDPCSRAQCHKSNRRTVSSRPARRWKGASLPQCNIVPKSPEKPLRLGFGWS